MFNALTLFGGGGHSLIGHIRPQWVKFLGHKPADGLNFCPKNLCIGHNLNTLNLSTGHCFNNSS